MKKLLLIVLSAISVLPVLAMETDQSSKAATGLALVTGPVKLPGRGIVRSPLLREHQKDIETDATYERLDADPTASDESYRADIKTFSCPIIPVGNADTAKHIALLSIHGTWGNNAGMGAHSNRTFSDAIRAHAIKLAREKKAYVNIVAPTWNGQLAHTGRQLAANQIHGALKELNKQRPIDEIHGLAHSHGCNVLLTLAQFSNNSGFNIRNILKTMALLAPPRVEIDQLYNYPNGCTTLAFYSENDATQQLGSLERGQGFEQRIPMMRNDAGNAYNINVRYLPDIVGGHPVGKPHHRSIKQPSLIDCLPTIQEFATRGPYSNYYDLQLWIPQRGGGNVYQPIIALNDAKITNETDETRRKLAETSQRDALDYINKRHPEFDKPTGYLAANLVWREAFYKEPKTLTQ